VISRALPFPMVGHPACLKAWQRLIIRSMGTGHRKSTIQLAHAVAAFVSEGRSQAWIAQRLNMSQPRVSQLLSYLADTERPIYKRGRPRIR